ncbi:type I-E CRISPR-associated protein Cas6/Cse3/CasE [Streptomyces parvus]|uniref:type I-E CRISPR-associated protein Cas6/Cse3/CasE n=1 Tax=Streptomyces parvus TaxID=66428 RepID=UPI002100C8C4|nr:type I-E CRISPR-associated protein Cas6/Cse3/CasE [Streptomyces parvus]MCQ1577194.1 type I-E CRISPR-associated protein Cas6/Cse3/CasE [Streptomyces parvus]
MTHLTRCPLNPARARRLTTSPQRLHAAVASAFPPPPTGQTTRHRVLWRLDEKDHEPTLLILSPTPPDLTHLVEQAGWPRLATPNAPGWETRPYAPLLDHLHTGMRLRFRLTANPTRAVSRPGRRGIRTALTAPADQIQWLLDRAASAGFTVPVDERISPAGHHVTVSATRALRFPRTTDSGARRDVHLHTATYDGLLDVTDPDALRRTLTDGIGHGKAYGCGLLTLARFAA